MYQLFLWPERSRSFCPLTLCPSGARTCGKECGKFHVHMLVQITTLLLYRSQGFSACQALLVLWDVWERSQSVGQHPEKLNIWCTVQQYPLLGRTGSWRFLLNHMLLYRGQRNVGVSDFPTSFDAAGFAFAWGLGVSQLVSGFLTKGRSTEIRRAWRFLLCHLANVLLYVYLFTMYPVTCWAEFLVLGVFV